MFLSNVRLRDLLKGAVLRLTLLLLSCAAVHAAGIFDARGTANQFKKPVAMKVLLLGAPGIPGFDAMKTFLDQIGIPYEALSAVPVLESNGIGKYQGIIVANGGLPTAELDAYAASYGVRTIIYYAWPWAPQYGVVPAFTVNPAIPAGVGSTGTVQVLSVARGVFDYLNASAALEFKFSYAYPLAPYAAAGETSTPVLSLKVGSSQYTAGMMHQKADGREYFFVGMDNNPYLIHSMALGYGMLRWVTRGVFLGDRKTYLSPQVDDVLIATDLFDARNQLCVPGGFVDQPTFDPLGACAILKITGADFDKLATWQAAKQKTAQFAKFKVAMAFNGYGVDPQSGLSQTDGAKEAATKYANTFFWLSHTYDHENLDCYQAEPNSPASSCVPANAADSLFEISQNVKVAKRLTLNFDAASMVTPNLSGLTNPEFLAQAFSQGLRYFVTDWSRVRASLPGPNTGLRQPTGSNSVLLIPRYATNIFYNTSTAATGAPGSQTDEYNHFYAPGGISPFFPTAQTYANIVNTESSNILTYMLSYSVYPLMYHQANLYAYSGGKSLLSDVMDAAMQKFQAISTLPVISLSQAQMGAEIEERMSYQQSKAAAVLYPGSRIEVVGSSAATVPVTGVCGTACESYGGDNISHIPVKAGQVASVGGL